MNIKTVIVAVILFTLTSCGVEDDKAEDILVVDNICNNLYTIGEVDKATLQLKGVVISNEIKTISSPMAGTIDYLNCDAGKEVHDKTLIAKISPDFKNPNIINLSIQKGSLVNQRSNLESVKVSTISSFDIQISNLYNQISSLREQVKLLEKNIILTKKSSSLNKDDLGKQIEILEETLSNLEKNLGLSEKAKTEALEKIDISRENLLTSISNISRDNLLKIDEIFGITTENKDLNDVYDVYISAKNSNLRDSVENEFRRLNLLNIDNLDDGEISIFLGDLIILNDETKKSVKESIANVYLTQLQIDAFYTIFLNYSSSLAGIKNNWDNLDNSKSSVHTSYDTQISSITNQIATSKTSLENLKTNKVDSVDVGLDLQLSGLDTQLKTLESNLDNLLSQKSNLQATKNTQILNLKNQILQVNQNIDSLNTNLSARNIYAEISGKIKQKVSSKGNNIGINFPICQIIPNDNSTKIKIYSPIELNMGDKLVFDFNGDEYQITIENVLVYKDTVTQNYVYESNYLVESYFKDGEILSLSFDNITQDNNDIEDQVIKVPVGYIKNRINGNFIRINSNSGVTEKEVVLGDINGNFIEIKYGLEEVIEICK